MKSRYLLILLVLVMGGLAACGDRSGVPLLLDVDSQEVETPDVRLSGEVTLDLLYADINAAEFQAQEGQFLWPCLKDEDCLSGHCLETAGGFVCAGDCDAGCPAGWSCGPLAADPDGEALCVPEHGTACRPCLSDGDCAQGLDLEVACVDFAGDGHFCASSCSVDADCPAGYECGQQAQSDGVTLQVCVPASGSCGCAKKYTGTILTTECYEANEYGSCFGERVCQLAGLSACDAQLPEAEICDGLDNDCDGEVDEGIGGEACSIDNNYGSCPGTFVCAAGQGSCDAQTPQSEICNGVDENCNGLIDEGALVTFYVDNDGDGFGGLGGTVQACEVPDGYAVGGTDCNDFNEAINPAAAEVCNDGDDDCDGMVDDGLDEVQIHVDLDGDGFGAAGTPGYGSCLLDTDGDGFGDTAPKGYAIGADDCNDANSQVYPGANELCDGILNDCLAPVPDFQCPESCAGSWPVYLGVTSGQVSVAQLDMTNALEILVQGNGMARTLTATGEIRWEIPGDFSYSLPLLADANLDGFLDAVLIDDYQVRIVDGSTGAILESFDVLSTGARFGAVFDLDNDGHFDVVTPAHEDHFGIILRDGLGGAKAIHDIAPPDGVAFIGNTPGIVDLEGDGTAEVVFATGYVTCNSPGQPDCNGRLLFYDAISGEMVSLPDAAFAVPDAGNAYASGWPLVVDVDGDGEVELFQNFGYVNGEPKRLAWALDGSPASVPEGWYGQPVLAPIDEWGELALDGQLRDVGGATLDLDGNALYEVVGLHDGGLSIKQGETVMDGYPLPAAVQSPVITDLNRDGRLDVLFLGKESASLHCLTLGNDTYEFDRLLGLGTIDVLAHGRYRTGTFDPFEPNDRRAVPFDPGGAADPIVESRAFPVRGFHDVFYSSNGWHRRLPGMVSVKGDRDYYHASGKQFQARLETAGDMVDLRLLAHLYLPVDGGFQYLTTLEAEFDEELGQDVLSCHVSTPCPDDLHSVHHKLFIFEVRGEDENSDYGPWPYQLYVEWGAK